MDVVSVRANQRLARGMWRSLRKEVGKEEVDSGVMDRRFLVGELTRSNEAKNLDPAYLISVVVVDLHVCTHVIVSQLFGRESLIRS